MAGAVKPMPAGYPTLAHHLIPRDWAAAIAFYEGEFVAHERVRVPGPDGTIGHAELGSGRDHLCLQTSGWFKADVSAWDRTGSLPPR